MTRPTTTLGLTAACAAVFTLGLSLDAWAKWDKPINAGSWRMAAPEGTLRWLVVRKVPSGQDATFHVEVLQRKSNDPPWKFDRLAAHLAVTESALRQSILGPLRQSEPYPESYEEAYRTWLSAAEAGNSVVCSTTVMQCLQ